MHPGPKSGDERITLLGVLQGNGSTESDRLVVLNTGNDHLARLVASFRQIATEDNLLRPDREIRELLGIDSGRPQPPEFDFQVADSRFGDFAQQLDSDRLGTALTGDLPDRSATQRSDRIQHDRLEAAAYRHRVEGNVLALADTPESLGKGNRIGVRGGVDTVTDVDHLRFGAALFQRGSEDLIQIGPTQRPALGQELSRGPHVFGVRRDRLLESPIALDVATGQVEFVLRPQRGKYGRHELLLHLARVGIHRSGGIGQDQQVQRLAVGQYLPLLVGAGGSGSHLQHEVSVLAAAMWDQHGIGAVAVKLDYDFEVGRRRVLLGSELDLGRMPGLLRSREVRRRGHVLQRGRRVDGQDDPQLAKRMLLEHFALQAVTVSITVTPKRQHLGVGDFDSLLGMGEDGKHSSFEEVPAGPFQQARVPFLSKDDLVDLPCPLFFDNVGFHQFVADPHAEAGNRGVLRQGEVKHALQYAVGMVDERFFDHRSGNLIAYVYGHLVIADRQRLVAAVDVGDQGADRFVRRRPVEAAKPERVFLDANQFAALHPPNLLPLDDYLLLFRPLQFDGRFGGGRYSQFPGKHADLLRANQLD